MKLAIILGLALSTALTAPCMARDNPGGATPGTPAAVEALSGRINELQAAIVESMRASVAADRQRRVARVSADINALQAAIVQAVRERGLKD